jgi:hypothetical protein
MNGRVLWKTITAHDNPPERGPTMPGMKNSLRVMTWMAKELAVFFANIAGRLALPVRHACAPGDPWWKKPGLGIMYQIEYRPGMDWDRDYTRFNPSMMDESGRIRFNGPFCKIADWVDLSRQIGADYHIFEAKWHDGICYFNTSLTGWKTETDYCAQFAEGSRAAAIPFMYYYSAVFDHNPQFDALQPHPRSTFSALAMDHQPQYEDYLRGQFTEIMEQYRPDGMWLDWYWPDRSTSLALDFFRSRYPETVLTFNLSHYFPSAYKQLHYTTGEAHDLSGNYVKLIKTRNQRLPIFTGAWKWANLLRRVMNHSFELISPAGRWWQDPSLRDDPNDLLRMTAIILASGGRFCIGTSAQLSGDLYPDQVTQLKLIGEWYLPRKKLFTASVPLRYRSEQVPGIKVSPASVKTIATVNAGDTLLHLINLDGGIDPVVVDFRGRRWRNLAAASLEPSGEALKIETFAGAPRLTIPPADNDPVDTVVRLKSN